MASSAPSPKLTKSTALAKVQTLTARVQALVPTLTTGLSPTTVYEPDCPVISWGNNQIGPGNVLIAGGGSNTIGAGTAWPLAGVWTAPDANGDGSSYQVQVECFGAGAGGGSGGPTQGGGGGGGGEYAAEIYTVTPGQGFVYSAGGLSFGGAPYSNLVSPGSDGSPTVFDVLGTGVPGGVFANGGQGGDSAGTGIGGAGGTGSANTIHADGGAGGTSTGTGGAGGGSTGGIGGAGGTGSANSGGTGGAGGIPATTPDYLLSTTANAVGGAPGADEGSVEVPGLTVRGGGGGGLGGGYPSIPTGGTATYGFIAAASYNGTDANGGTAAAGALYSSAQQGTSSVLFVGAGPNDYASGAKNSLLIMDPSIYPFLGFSPSTANPGFWKAARTVEQVSLTVFNANPGNPNPVLVSISVTYDTSLPGSYTGQEIVKSDIAVIVIPAGADSVTIDLSDTVIFGTLTGEWTTRITAISLGPGSTPGDAAYGDTISGAFSAQVYGPGAIAPDGVTSLAPRLNIVYANAPVDSGGYLFAIPGGAGAPGGILVSFINAEGTPIAGVNAFAITDSVGNQWAAGYTGSVSAWNPEQAPLGVFEPEPWHQLVSYGTGWAASGIGYSGFFWRLLADGDVELAWDIRCSSGTPGAICTLPGEYAPVTGTGSGIAIDSGWTGTGPASYNGAFSPSIGISLAGVVTATGLAGTQVRLFGQARYPIANLAATAVNG